MKKDRKVKENRIKKKLSAETSSNLTTLIVILVTLGITIPLHIIFQDKLTSYWVIAICVAVISPFALANFKINMEAKGSKNVTTPMAMRIINIKKDISGFLLAITALFLIIIKKVSSLKYSLNTSKCIKMIIKITTTEDITPIANQIIHV